jgi:hypothetical protein
MFERKDPNETDYSRTEVDLYPAVGPDGEAYSIRRNFDDDLYEIFDYESPRAYTDAAVWFSEEELEPVVWEARDLEVAATGGSELEYGHNPQNVQCNKSWRDIDNDLGG